MFVKMSRINVKKKIKFIFIYLSLKILTTVAQLTFIRVRK